MTHKMRKINFLMLIFISLVFTSCITTKEVKYLQPSESLVINEEGLVPYNIQEYRVTKNDIFDLNVVTTPKGDAAQFYSSLNATGAGVSNPAVGGGNIGNIGNAGGGGAGNSTFYFNGLKVDSKEISTFLELGI